MSKLWRALSYRLSDFKLYLPIFCNHMMCHRRNVQPTTFFARISIDTSARRHNMPAQPIGPFTMQAMRLSILKLPAIETEEGRR
jgi:hypothetical protein